MAVYKCPKCGMEYEKPGLCEMDGTKLVKAGDKEFHAKHEHKQHEHTNHHGHMIKDFKKRFVISAMVTIPILLLSPLIQNLFWAAGYNIIAIPLAAGVLYNSYNILLPPAIGAVFMSVSTVIVALNAQSLSIKKLRESKKQTF